MTVARPNGMDQSTERQKFHELVSSMKCAMLVTRRRDGQLHARPMVTAETTEDGTMRFITAIESGKIDEVLNDHHVSVTYQQDGAFLAVSGTAAIETDPSELQRVWTVGSEVWFKSAGASNKAALIVVTPQFAEYWDQSGIKALKYAFETLRAAVTGDNVRVPEEQHGTVDVRTEASA
jgi:general stress protein 26